MGGEISFDLAVPGNERGRLHVLVEADAGLREVAVYDGERLFRRFRPEGKRFETFITISGDSYHCYSMTVTDRQGRKAVSWNAFLQIQERVHRRCGDNWNWMSTGKRAGSAGTPAFPYNLHETTHGWRTKSLEEAAPARQLYWCEQNSYGHGGLSGVVNGYIRGGGLLVGGGPWPKGYPAPAITLNFATIGRYGSILTTTVRDEKLVPKLEPYTIGAFSGPYKVTPSPWPADLKQFVPLSKPDGATINRYQGSVRFLKEVKSPDRATIPIGLGATGKPTARTVEIMSPDGTSIRRQASGEVITGAVPVGGYVCWYDDEGDGVGGMIALSPGLHYSYSTKWQEFYLEAPSPVEAGTEFTWDVIFVSGNRSTTNSNAQMEDVRLGMGIAGKPTLYDVRLRTGKILDQKYFLTLDAERGGCSAKIVKTTKKLLPIHLPAMLHGLNPRWSAVIWYRGLARLHTPDYYRDRWGVKTWRWVIGKYDLRTDEVRPIPVLDGGIGYCQIDTDKQNPDVFIGNPLVCTRPEVFLTLVKAERGQCTFDINNPTDRALRCTVRPAKGFDLVGSFRKVIKLAPGAFKTVTVVGR
jgi:hypothetical protein